MGGGGGTEKEDSGRAGELEESGRDGRKRGREGGKVNDRLKGDGSVRSDKGRRGGRRSHKS